MYWDGAWEPLRRFCERAQVPVYLNGAGIRYVVSGLYALYEYTGIYRETKDLDLFVEPGDLVDAAGVLKEAGRRVIPADVIDRPKGYFPVPALKYLQGPYLDLVRDALHAPEARARGLFRADYVDRLLADPNGELTPLRGNKLWQLGLLELWLQAHQIT